MKYIVFEDFSGKPVPFIFPHKVEHSDMREQMPYARVLSAGYVCLQETGFQCHGSAPDLQVSAQEQDAALISDFFLQNMFK